MSNKDYIVIISSGLAVTISFISLIVTLIQKRKETNRTIRKTLTDTLENISKIGIETARLKTSNFNDYNSETIIQLIREFNTQRRILIVHADFLISKNDKIAAEIDCLTIAVAYSEIGDNEKAIYFWNKTIEKSVSLPIRHMNLRGFGIYYFSNGNIVKGREKFEEALKLNLESNDTNKIMVSDTYLMLADYEKDILKTEDYEKHLKRALDICSVIVNGNRRNEMEKRITSRLEQKSQ